MYSQSSVNPYKYMSPRYTSSITQNLTSLTIPPLLPIHHLHTLPTTRRRHPARPDPSTHQKRRDGRRRKEERDANRTQEHREQHKQGHSAPEEREEQRTGERAEKQRAGEQREEQDWREGQAQLEREKGLSFNDVRYVTVMLGMSQRCSRNTTYREKRPFLGKSTTLTDQP